MGLGATIKEVHLRYGLLTPANWDLLFKYDSLTTLASLRPSLLQDPMVVLKALRACQTYGDANKYVMRQLPEGMAEQLSLPTRMTAATFAAFQETATRFNNPCENPRLQTIEDAT
jgi:hypothetical protein